MRDSRAGEVAGMGSSLLLNATSSACSVGALHLNI